MTHSKYFKINEVSKLYNIGIDSLRYYEEIGLISPIRGENNYRYYSFDDLMRLNIIREYRSLNFSFAQIKETLKGHSLNSTIDILKAEHETLTKEISSLRQKKKTIEQRIKNIQFFTQDTPIGEICIKELPSFKCLHISYDEVHQDNIDYYISDYLHTHSIDISNFIGRYDLYRLDISKLYSETEYSVKEALIVNNAMRITPDYSTPAGKYLVINYNSPSSQSLKYTDLLLDYAVSHNIKLTDDIFEICIFDLYDTSIKAEYLTSIWIRIQPSV